MNLEGVPSQIGQVGPVPALQLSPGGSTRVIGLLDDYQISERGMYANEQRGY